MEKNWVSSKRFPFLLIFLCAVLSSIGYLWTSSRTYGIGFPLDDAWIHQTYANNLVRYGEWSFLPGVPSAGSTSPLWSFLVAFGPLLGLEPKIWTYAIGTLVLAIMALLAMKWFRHRWPDKGNWAWFLGLMIVFEWHLSWAAVSGMEALTFALIAMLVLYAISDGGWDPFYVGLLIGAGVWVRPGALTLLLPSMAAAYDKDGRRMACAFLKIGCGFLLLLIPYLAFNSILTGTLWPNTFYAKQAEYAILRQKPLMLRYVQQSIQPMIGVAFVLVPGGIVMLIKTLRAKKWRQMLPFLWVLLYWGMYAMQLPVTYQHGRYAIPTIPILLLMGSEGLLGSIDWNALAFRKRFLSRAWFLTSLAVMGAFWLIGAKAYGQDVAIIETEMVSASRWIAVHTEETALIAAHDIGALGYFGQREILDLAGLISPQVIPIIRDEAALREFLNEQGADYLMTFPNWYPMLVQEAQIVYETEGSFSPRSGGENMTVYRWKR